MICKDMRNVYCCFFRVNRDVQLARRPRAREMPPQLHRPPDYYTVQTLDRICRVEHPCGSVLKRRSTVPSGSMPCANCEPRTDTVPPVRTVLDRIQCLPRFSCRCKFRPFRIGRTRTANAAVDGRCRSERPPQETPSPRPPKSPSDHPTTAIRMSCPPGLQPVSDTFLLPQPQT